MKDGTLNELFYGYNFINELLHTVNSKILGFERGVLYILHIDSATWYDLDKGSACSIKLPGCFCCPLILLVIISLVGRIALLINILAAYRRVHFYLSLDKISLSDSNQYWAGGEGCGFIFWITKGSIGSGSAYVSVNNYMCPMWVLHGLKFPCGTHMVNTLR